MATSTAGPASEPPRWLADAMLGKLARYLRFLGHDTAYARDVPDTDVADQARREHRTLLTRDRSLSARVSNSLLLRAADLSGQLREVATAFPVVPFVVTLDRCPECNLPLQVWSGSNGEVERERLPSAWAAGGAPVRQCPECRRRYWDGSHAARIRAIVTAAVSAGGPA